MSLDELSNKKNGFSVWIDVGYLFLECLELRRPLLNGACFKVCLVMQHHIEEAVQCTLYHLFPSTAKEQVCAQQVNQG